MKDNPYLPPTTCPEILLRDLPREERKKLILAGDTTAGPLTVFLYEHPIWSAIIGATALGAFLAGCWTCIQM